MESNPIRLFIGTGRQLIADAKSRSNSDSRLAAASYTPLELGVGRLRAQAAVSILQKVRRAVSCMVRAVADVSWPKLAEPRVVTNVPKLV